MHARDTDSGIAEAARPAPASNKLRVAKPKQADADVTCSQQTATGLAVARGTRFLTKVVEDPALLEDFIGGLNDLASSASEPNVFYEPWMLLPALRAFGRDASFAFVLIFSSSSVPGKLPLLCGFFPLQIERGYRGVPVKVARLWSYLHFKYCPPLIRKGYEERCLEAFCEWACSESGPSTLLEFGSLPADGALNRALIDVVNKLGLPRYVSDLYCRALLRRDGDAEACLRRAVSGRRLKEFGRLERRLAERGGLTYEELGAEGEVSTWIEDFLRLEAAGWKGQAGTALASTPEQRSFFSEVTSSAFSRRQLMMLRLRLDGRPLAYKCNFLSEPGAFSFKIAYDEEYSSFSPGVLLELENIRRFHASTRVEWMDSCADADHFMANHLWSDRRPVQTTVVAVRGPFSGLLLSALPLARWTKHNLKSFLRKWLHGSAR